jgi:hypothetical protein
MNQKFILLLSLAIIGSCSKEPRKKSLIVAEYAEPGMSGTFDYTWLVRYNFEDGVLSSKDTILGAGTIIDSLPGSYVRFDLGKNFIYKNRYLISGIGNVIDLQTGRLVIEESDKFIEAKGDSLIFHRDNFKGTGYLLLDLPSGNYGFIQDTNYRSVSGLLSPDLKHGIGLEQSVLPRMILLCDKENGCKVIVRDGGNGTYMSIMSSSFSNVPVFWLDNSNFIYGRFSDSFDIRKVNILTGKEEIIGRIDSIPHAVSESYFLKDANENLLFYCTKGTYLVDPVKNTLVKQVYHQYGNDFTSELNNDSLGNRFYYRSESIGKAWSNWYSAVTAPEYFAVEYGEPGSNLGYPKGFKVWNNITREWTTVDVRNISAVIGWTD